MSIKLNTFPNGVIGQIGPTGIDGGDSVNWQGHRMYLEDTPPMSMKAYIDYFKGERTGWVRHPASATTSRFYVNPWHGNISRDQFTGILAAHCKHTNYKSILQIIWHHMAWALLFSYNTVRNGDESLKWKWPDLTLFDIWAMEIRALGWVSWLFWPVLCFFDIHMLLNTMAFNLWSEDDDSISFAIKAIVQKEKTPTIISLISWVILDKTKLNRLVHSYWCGWRSNCNMAGLYKARLK